MGWPYHEIDDANAFYALFMMADSESIWYRVYCKYIIGYITYEMSAIETV